MKVNERFIWAAIILDIQPNDRVLEIGCGTGILVDQVAGKLDSGTITAIDRSAAMIRMASKRNALFISGGKVKLRTGDFTKLSFDQSEFSKIAAFNVNFFWKNPEQELEIIRRILQPHGELYIFYQAPYEIDINAADPIKQKLEQSSFEITDTILKQMKPSSAFCIKSKPMGK